MLEKKLDFVVNCRAVQIDLRVFMNNAEFELGIWPTQ